MENKGKLKEY